MDYSKLRVLIMEDSVYKAMDITKALEYCGVRDIQRVRNQEAGFELIYDRLEQGSPIQLIVSDMHYPLAPGEEPDHDAGEILISRLRQERLRIPVIICSSRNLTEPEALGTVWYNELQDLNRDFKEILNRL